MFKVIIVYKSGYVHTDIYKSFSVVASGADITEVKWETCRYTKYQNLHLCVTDISAVFSKKYSWWLD